MKAWITIIVIMIVVSIGTSFTGANQKKEYQRGYDAGYPKGYEDAIKKYMQQDALRQEQFITQMKRMETVINKYNKATKDITGL